jgi:glycerate 2-kinase
MSEARQFLLSLFDAAIRSATPEHCMSAWTPEKPDGRVVVVGAGKAAASMAAQLEKTWTPPLTGRVIVPYGYAVECSAIEVVEAAHPIPDARGVAEAREILKTAGTLSAGDTLVCLISGGGSSLLCVPAPGISLVDKQSVTSGLLRSGATIHEINIVRKKLSAIKGGRLAAAAGDAAVITLVISDVSGNDAAMVASGPTIADTSSASEALEILQRFKVSISDDIRDIILKSETVRIEDGDVRILATSDDALIAASAVANEQGVAPYSLGDLSGDAREIAREHAALALEITAGNGPLPPPCVLLSGGETTVNVTGDGRGGRNGEYALELALALDGHPAIHAIACDTDGIDGACNNAGCYVSPETLQAAKAAGRDALALQHNNDSYAFFKSTGGLVVTGATFTNVNDFRAILISDSQTAN